MGEWGREIAVVTESGRTKTEDYLTRARVLINPVEETRDKSDSEYEKKG